MKDEMKDEMKRTFCDICDNPISEDFEFPDAVELEAGRPLGKKLLVKFIAPAYGDICTHCFIDAVNRMDDRPRPA